LNGESTETRDQKVATEEKIEAIEPASPKIEELSDETQESAQQAAEELQHKVAALEAEVETKAGIITGLEDQLARLSSDYEGARAAYAYAVEDFKKLVLQTNPLFTPDIIGGNTMDELKSSVEKANFLVAKIKTQMQAKSESESESSRVPAGAPARTGPDVSAMSTREKINLGLEQARKKRD
jgi:uncharacterized coiled-coil protein SlyX